MDINYFVFQQLSCIYKTFFIPDFISFGETEIPKTPTLFIVSTAHKFAASIMSNLFSNNLYFAVNKSYLENSIIKYHASSLKTFAYSRNEATNSTADAIKHLNEYKNLVLFINMNKTDKDNFELLLAESILKQNKNIGYLPVAITGLEKVLPPNSFIPKVTPVRAITACPAIQAQISKEQLFSELTFLKREVSKIVPDALPSIFNNIKN